jgi:hypothetical protein
MFFRKKLAKIAKIGDHNNNSCLDKQTKIFELFWPIEFQK